MQANKALVSLVVGLGFFIAAGLIILVFGLYKKAADPDFQFFAPPSPPAAAGTAPTTKLTLPRGARILAATQADGRLVIHAKGPGARETIVVVDLESGRVLRSVEFQAAP
jgi:hypothetical protein